jgi:pimeloyl-ACP methyl ester carboxylesterase
MQNIYLAKNINDVPLDKKNIPTIGKKLPYFLELSNFGHSTIFPHYDVTNDLYKITVLTLLLAGERDWINNVAYAHQMHELISNFELVVFPEAGHFIWKGIEEQFYEKIAAFISTKVMPNL